MTTYRLPDVLGGSEVEVLHGMASLDGRADVIVPGVVGVVTLSDANVLVVVPPPLPEEPGFAAVVLDRHDRAWQHLAFSGRGDWCCPVDDLGADWEELNREHGPLTRLIPAPVVEPVTLPWTGHPEKEGANAGACWADLLVKASSRYSGRGLVTVTTGATFAHLTPDTADAMAAALTTAAAKARQS